MAYSASSNPFANAGTSMFGQETSMGSEIGNALKSFGTAYLLNSSGLQGFMDKTKAGFKDNAAIPEAMVPSQTTGDFSRMDRASVPLQNPSMGTAPPSQVTIGGPLTVAPLQITNLPPLATDDDGHSILRSGMLNNQGF